MLLNRVEFSFVFSLRALRWCSRLGNEGDGDAVLVVWGEMVL